MLRNLRAIGVFNNNFLLVIQMFLLVPSMFHKFYYCNLLLQPFCPSQNANVVQLKILCKFFAVVICSASHQKLSHFVL